MKSNSVKSMKLLYVAPRYHTNQVPIMRGFHKYDCKVMFMAQYEGVNEVHDNVDFYLLKKSPVAKWIFRFIDKKYGPSIAEGKKTKWFLPSFFDTLRTIKKFGPDLVIIRERYISTIVIYRICKLLGIRKTILYVQQPIYDGEQAGGKLKNALKTILFPKAVFSPIYYHGKKRNKENRSDIYFVPLVVEGKNYSEVTNRSYFKDEVIHFLDIGKYREYKNHFFLADVFDKLNKKGLLSGAKLTIIGQVANCNEEEYFGRLQKYINEKDLQSVIELRRNIPYEEMDALYMENDVLLLPSTYESAGMVIPEAMEKGLCVVAGIFCGLSSYLEEYQCGYTFNLDSTKSLETVLGQLLENRDSIIKMGQKSSSVVQEHLLFEHYLEKLNELTQKEFDYTIYE